jgi:hypothetical protein
MPPTSLSGWKAGALASRWTGGETGVGNHARDSRVRRLVSAIDGARASCHASSAVCVPSAQAPRNLSGGKRQTTGRASWLGITIPDFARALLGRRCICAVPEWTTAVRSKYGMHGRYWGRSMSAEWR